MAAFFKALAAFPALISAIFRILAFIQTQIREYVKRKAEAEMIEAIEKAKKTKDSSGIDAAFDPKKKE